MMMTKEEMIVDMQMGLKTGYMIENFLFKDFVVMNWWTFVLVLLMTAFFALVSETAGHILRTRSSKLNTLVFGLMRAVNYSQMLMVMSYNVWVILVLCVSQTAFRMVFNSWELSK